MITSYKDRVIDINKPVLIYKNLTNGLFSIMQNNRVVGHTDKLDLILCECIVRESGRQRVLKEKKKYVHAFVKGYILTDVSDQYSNNKLIYNPFKFDQFYLSDGNNLKEPLLSWRYHLDSSKGIYLV